MIRGTTPTFTFTIKNEDIDLGAAYFGVASVLTRTSAIYIAGISALRN